MLQSQKHVFWQALFVTILIFGVGLIFGIFLENWRSGVVDRMYQQSEIDLNDIRLQSEIYSSGLFDCESAASENLKFADRIYNQSKFLDRYENANQITDQIIAIHKKYDILRANLLLNSVQIKKKCNISYHEVVYFYKYHNPGMDIKAKQNVFSRILGEVKTNYGENVLLIPIAGDSDAVSIALIRNKYGISENNLPVVLINGKIRITELESYDDLVKNFD